MLAQLGGTAQVRQHLERYLELDAAEQHRRPQLLPSSRSPCKARPAGVACARRLPGLRSRGERRRFSPGPRSAKGRACSCGSPAGSGLYNDTTHRVVSTCRSPSGRARPRVPSSHDLAARRRGALDERAAVDQGRSLTAAALPIAANLPRHGLATPTVPHANENGRCLLPRIFWPYGPRNLPETALEVRGFESGFQSRSRGPRASVAHRESPPAEQRPVAATTTTTATAAWRGVKVIQELLGHSTILRDDDALRAPRA